MSVDWSDLEALRMTVRAISVWPGQATPNGARLASPFKGNRPVRDADGRTRRVHGKTPFATTVKDLTRELEAVNARKPELGLALRERDIRRDGFPNARAVPQHPGVIVAFNMPALQGRRLTYAVDRFVSWQDNLRAIALGLEALRKVQRYGMGTGYEQYAGYRALAEVSSQTPEEAKRVLLEYAELPTGEVFEVRRLFSVAAKKAQHVDEGAMNAVMNAGRVLGVIT